jgi:UDP-glucose 4-epimerase
MSRHCITGGGGFLGSALARRLVDEGEKVVVLDHFQHGKRERLPREAEYYTSDVRYPFGLQRAVDGAEVVWHLAYVRCLRMEKPRDVIETALRGIMNVLDACEGAKHSPDMVLVSSPEVYPALGMVSMDERVSLTVTDVTDSRYAYGGGKIACEVATMAFEQSGAFRRGMIVRPHNVYGPDMGYEHMIPEFATRMLGQMGRNEHAFHIQGSGFERRSFCFIDDCVDGLMRVWDQGRTREVYHLGNPYEEIATGDLARMVAEYFGWDIEVVASTKPSGPGRLPDISKLEQLGYRPKTSFSTGLAKTLKWYEHEEEIAS